MILCHDKTLTAGCPPARTPRSGRTDHGGYGAREHPSLRIEMVLGQQTLGTLSRR